ncbi:MAG: flagellar biosynthesis protein FlgC [Nitrospirae bacterium]|nr:flagellar biosynthesis protein FlgC [Candidatus Manganitrophaceae bacterium]
MISAINSSQSGISAGLKRQEVSANNVANISTEGFKKDTIVQNEGSTGGVVVQIEKSSIPGPQFPEADGSLIEGSNVDLAEEAVNQSIAATTFGANLAALKATQQAEKSIIDLFA